MDWDQVSIELKKPLAAEAVRPPPKGKFGEYVDGKHVIDEANRIFGHNGWSYTVTRLQMVSEQTVELKGRDGPYEQYRVGYLCTVLVNVDGVTREGTAVGSGNGNVNSMADQHESAVKEAETDALKRALRSFGNTFGLALYEKDKDKREVESRPDPAQIATLKSNMLTAMNNAATAEIALNISNSDKFDADLQRLRTVDGDAAQEVIEAIENATKKEAA